ncbi:NAD(P)-dependent oxidoreductase [Methylosinus sp. Ce-a6]|uniref:NAD-dependent epimerase/dehydratase family protein n=1 Tax=Methylosinus sp. Ce-a6 TaxID=2172005 RepID=UPI00135A73C6|nr:NAD(P)-dependent oxidoreductase [Methylosinus sp. Ce-a6]
MRLFLTGATGFIGSRLARRLVHDGRQLSILVRAGSDTSILGDAATDVAVHVYDGSLASIVAALDACRPDVVVHVASLFLAQHKPEDVERLVDSNIGMPAKLVEAMSCAGVKRFVNTGTSWQHYEDQPYSPVNLYSATKQAFEDLLAYWVEAKGLRAVTLKLFDTYGPGDPRPKLFNLLRRHAFSGDTLKMSPGEQLLDLVYVDDVTDAYVSVIEGFDALQRDCYAVSNPQRYTLRQLVDIYADIVRRPIRIEWGGQPYRPRETLIPWTTGFRPEGWLPKVTLQEGIRRMEGIETAA